MLVLSYNHIQRCEADNPKPYNNQRFVELVESEESGDKDLVDILV